MKVYAAGTAVDLVVPLVDDEGRDLVPTAVSYRVLDDEGEIIKSPESIIGPYSTKLSITTSAATNTLTIDTVGFRRIEVTVTTASAVETLTIDYILEEKQPFVVPSNSFMTYETALVVSRMVTPLNGWNAATPESRRFAMFRAFDQLNAFTYQFRYTTGESETMTIAELDAESFALVSTSQLGDFRKAQLMQADFLLGGSPIEKDIHDGLQSSTIGEISQFYRPRPTLNLAICKNALSYVGKYIDWNVKIGRA